MKSFLKKFGGVDVLINNAGAVYDHINFRSLDEKSWQNTFDLNVRAPFYLSGKVFDYMKKRDGGRIINISSVNVKYGGSAKSMHYVALKTALESITRGFAHGCISLTDDADILIMSDSYFLEERGVGIIWNDKDLNIDWNLNGAIPFVSERHKKYPSFRESKEKYGT